MISSQLVCQQSSLFMIAAIVKFLKLRQFLLDIRHLTNSFCLPT